VDRVAGAVSGAGEPVVELPQYFAKINKTPCYQLTAVGAPMPMEVMGNGLSIQTRAMPVEVEKQGAEKGTYQHSEVYGQSAEMGMNYVAPAERDLDHHPEDERPAPRTLPDATPH